MKLHYKGSYNLNPDSLPHGEHKPNAVPFKEAKDTRSLSFIANGLCVLITIFLGVAAWIRCQPYLDIKQLALGCIVPMFFLLPHEYLHALCFQKDVYLYTNFKQGMLFVIGPETMSKSRFIIMSMLPNLVFGIIPYIIGMIFPQALLLAVCGALCTGMGAGDYYNVFNALTQMPKGAKTYLYQFNSFWYIP